MGNTKAQLAASATGTVGNNGSSCSHLPLVEALKLVVLGEPTLNGTRYRGPVTDLTRHVVITGGDRGIGLGIALDCAAHGDAIAICGRDDAALEQARQQLIDAGAGLVLAVKSDLATSTGAAEFVDELRASGLVWNALVHAAGNPPSGGLAATDDDLWDRTMSIHVRSAFVLARELAPAMAAAGWGRIIAISSTAGQQAYRDHVAYCTAKAALEMLVQSLALELGRSGVTANSIAPTVILTKLGREVWGGNPQKAAWIVDKIPVGRLGEVDDVVGVARFLLSDDSRFVNGARIPCDGGLNVTQADGPPVGSADPTRTQ